MKLYFSPLRCSLAPRIVCYEASLDVTFVMVDTKQKRCEDGRDYSKINPLGLVPALEIREGDVLCENTAVLQFLGELRAEARLVPSRSDERRRLWQWLSLIGSELHRAVYTPLLDVSAPEQVKSYALGKAPPRLARLAAHLESRQFLLDEFSVADAYLFAVLNWSRVAPVPLQDYPALTAFQARVGARPSVARAYSEELALYAHETASAAEASRNTVAG